VRISRLTQKDSLRRFDCGVSEINKWANSKASKWSEQNRTKVFYAHNEDSITAIGFYSLSSSKEEGRKLVKKDRDIWSGGAPIIYIGYLAVNRNCQCSGIGRLLLIDSLRRAHLVSQHVAFYGVGLRSLNERTTRFYEQFGFGVAPNEGATPLMILPIQTLSDLFDRVPSAR
jgi:GNAT superfamily N-acetyltransferase